MSEENVDRYVEATEAFNRGDIDGWLSAYDPDVVFEPAVGTFEGSVTGYDGLRRFVAQLYDVFETYRVEYDDVLDAGDQVVALGTARSRGKGSGAETQGPVANVATFRDGKIVHLKDYGNRERALEAAGLSE